jgi:hypothetical protein
MDILIRLQMYSKMQKKEKRKKEKKPKTVLALVNRNTMYEIRFRQQICFIDTGKIVKNRNR